MRSPTSGQANFFTTIRVGTRGMFVLGTRQQRAVNKGFSNNFACFSGLKGFTPV